MEKGHNKKSSGLDDLLKLSREYASSVEKISTEKTDKKTDTSGSDYKKADSDSDSVQNPADSPAAQGPFAFDPANSVSARTASSPLHAAATPHLKEELVLWTAIAGLYYHVDDDEILESLTPGTPLLLFREPDNEHDRWAIMVTTQNGQMLGYVTRYKNETIARMMDLGYQFRAQVESEESLIENLPDNRQTPTEDDRLPFSIWLISEE